jgi:hypothetical protein
MKLRYRPLIKERKQKVEQRRIKERKRKVATATQKIAVLRGRQRDVDP